jgi:transcriptional regulator with XRE-family HTH domain
MKPIPVTPKEIRQVRLKEVGSRIEESRQSHGWNKKELAERARIRPERLARLEQGTREPRLIEMAGLADALGVSLDDLTHGPQAAAPVSPARVGQAAGLLHQALTVLGSPAPAAGERGPGWTR